jgi:hypothetical protein
MVSLVEGAVRRLQRQRDDDLQTGIILFNVVPYVALRIVT